MRSRGVGVHGGGGQAGARRGVADVRRHARRTDVAIEASDLTLVRGDLLGAVDAIHLARRTLRTIKGNLFWAFAYNVPALPLAAAGLLKSHARGGSDGVLLSVRGVQQPATAPVHQPHDQLTPRCLGRVHDPGHGAGSPTEAQLRVACLFRTSQRGGRNPARVTVTSRRTAAWDGRLLAAVRAWRQ